MTEFKHFTVMKKEAVEGLNPQAGLLYIDGTMGGGGHSKEILEYIQPNGRLISFDVDQDAIDVCHERLPGYDKQLKIVKSNFTKIPEVLQSLNIREISGGVLLDLGTSIHQLTTPEKGFSFMKDAPLDMRLDTDASRTAYDVVNEYSQDDLVKIFKEYGEERFSKRVAKSIIEARNTKTIQTTKELSDLVIKSIPRTKQKIHPATRVFQAIRIAVNDELVNLQNTLNGVVPLLSVNARISVISFHSLEDRIVKNTFRRFSSKCNCPKEQMICNCPPPLLEVITRKPILPSDDEIKQNPPSRSAKLRVAKKI